MGKNIMTPSATITEEEFVESAIHSGDYTVIEGRRALPSWLPEVLGKLNAIASLPDGWDSYGAPSPDIHKVEAAGGLLICLAVEQDFPKPYVNPTRSGGVQFEWENGSRSFELEIVGERAATFLYSDSDERVEETGDVFETESLSSVLTYIHRVASIM